MQQPMSANPVQVVVLGYPGIIDKQIKYRNMKTYLARQLIALGILQLIVGILCIIFQGVALGIFLSQIQNQNYGGYSIDFVGHGFWIGLLFLITGPFGIAGGIKRNRCQVITFNVLSIISAAFAACLLAIAIPAAVTYTHGQTYCGYTYYTTPSYDSYYNCYRMTTTGVAMEALMATLAFVEGIIAIWASVICCTIGTCCCHCGGSCCCPPSPIQNQFLMTGQHFPGQQQTIFVSQQQLGSNQQQQMVIPNQQHPYQQLQLPPNQQQPLFLQNSQQPIINLDPGQHVAQYIPQQLEAPPYSEQPSPYTALSPASRNEGSNIGLYTAMRDTLMYPEQNANSRNIASSAYYETPVN